MEIQIAEDALTVHTYIHIRTCVHVYMYAPCLRFHSDNVRHSTLNRMQSVSLNCHQLFQLAETEPDVRIK